MLKVLKTVMWLAGVGIAWGIVAACGDANDAAEPVDSGTDREASAGDASNDVIVSDGGGGDSADVGVGDPDIDACADGGCSAPAVCGDGIVTGNERCDTGDAGDAGALGCSAECKILPNYACDTPNQPCRKITCNDGVREGTEACDDGNGDLGDGCTPFCQVEPDCPWSTGQGGACTSRCGDGIKMAAEACDDGNRHDGDGCASDCTVEPGWSCAVQTTPASRVIPLVVRDFRLGWTVDKPQTRLDGHIDFENNVYQLGGSDPGIVSASLGEDGKPVYAKATGGTATTTDKAHFDQWYRTTNNVNVQFIQTLTLALVSPGNYAYSNNAFFPVDGRGSGSQGENHNFAFTTEARFWFQYQGGESLEFVGDDDMFLFINKRRAVNLGGIHVAQFTTVDLDARKTELGLTVGGVYEIAAWNAERHTPGSTYGLFLTGFTDPRSVCTR
jgi:fibro-slime domain-containing protein